jgi:drug/metabolite transporter (DMT)-like permease
VAIARLQWLWVFLWLSCSVLATIINKTLVSGGVKKTVDGITLAAFHYGVAAFVGWLNMCVFRRQHNAAWANHLSTGGNPWRWRSVALAATMSTSSKILTYFSYGLVPVSTAQTVKATQPIFQVLVCYLWLGESVSLTTILTLVPIVGGVGVASGADVNLDMVGGLLAVASGFCGVMYNTTCKVRARVCVCVCVCVCACVLWMGNEEGKWN